MRCKTCGGSGALACKPGEDPDCHSCNGTGVAAETPAMVDGIVLSRDRMQFVLDEYGGREYTGPILQAMVSELDEFLLTDNPAAVAYRAVRAVMDANRESHIAVGDLWEEKPVEYHLKHGRDHAAAADGLIRWRTDVALDVILEEIDNTITRFSMAKAKLLDSSSLRNGADHDE